MRRWSLFLRLFWKPALVLAVNAARMQLRWPFRRPAMARGPGVDLSLNCRAYDGDLSLPLGLALGSPIVPSGCEGKLRVALESLQGLRDLT